jgi:hypothetical protein
MPKDPHSNPNPNKPPSKERDLFVPSEFREQQLADLKGSPLSVLLAYKSYANKDGVAWPSLRTLAKVTGYGIDAVKAARKKLVETGRLIPVEQNREHGKFGRKQFIVRTVGGFSNHGMLVPKSTDDGLTVAGKSTHGTVGESTVDGSTVVGSTVDGQQHQEVTPSEGGAFEVPPKGKVHQYDAVRRPFDAERPACTKKIFSPSEKRKKLIAHLAAKIKGEDDLFLDYIERCKKRGGSHPFGDEEREAFAATAYTPDLNSPLLGFDFVMAVVDVYDKKRGKGISAGNLCSAIIDYCEVEKERNGYGHNYPPDFLEHRDRLRKNESARAQSSKTPMEAA